MSTSMTRWEAFQWMLDHPWSFPLSLGVVLAVVAINWIWLKVR